MTLDEALESLKLKFTSGNEIEVERATITREEYEAIMKAAGKDEKEFSFIKWYLGGEDTGC